MGEMGERRRGGECILVCIVMWKKRRRGVRGKND